MRVIFAIVATAAFLTSAESHGAGIPPLINYQGILTNATGDTVPPGTYTMRFTIYPTSVGGSPLWESYDGDPYVPVSVQHGLFNHLLGSSNDLPDSLAKYDSLWLGVTRGSDENEMMPRTPLVSVMYSFRSRSADSAHFADSANAVNVSGYSAYSDLVSEGRIGIGAQQVAPGDHSHGTYPSGMYRVEDTTAVQSSGSNVEVVIKSITIPAGEIGHFFRIGFAVSNFFTGQSAQTITRVRINGAIVSQWKWPYENIYGYCSIECAYLGSSTNWIGQRILQATNLYGVPALAIAQFSGVAPYEAVTVQVTAQSDSPAWPFDSKIGELIIMYDKDG